MIKIKEKTIKEWIPLEKIYKDGTIKLKNNNYIKIKDFPSYEVAY